jgi:hypothetical protein
VKFASKGCTVDKTISLCRVRKEGRKTEGVLCVSRLVLSLHGNDSRRPGSRAQIAFIRFSSDFFFDAFLTEQRKLEHLYI